MHTLSLTTVVIQSFSSLRETLPNLYISPIQWKLAPQSQRKYLAAAPTSNMTCYDASQFLPLSQGHPYFCPGPAPPHLHWTLCPPTFSKASFFQLSLLRLLPQCSLLPIIKWLDWAFLFSSLSLSLCLPVRNKHLKRWFYSGVATPFISTYCWLLLSLAFSPPLHWKFSLRLNIPFLPNPKAYIESTVLNLRTITDSFESFWSPSLLFSSHVSDHPSFSSFF